MSVNVVALLDDSPSAQHGYFTRAQAAAAGIEDFELSRAVASQFVHRVGHGVYRVAGAAHDPFAELRIAWFRLRPAATPRSRTLRPDIWVSHESAATVHGFGVFLADTATFIATDRLQPGASVTIHRRSKGLALNEWTVIDGFAVTSVNRTAADLHALGVDGGHLGRFMRDAIGAGATTQRSLCHDTGINVDDFEALIDMDTSPNAAA